MTTLSSSGLFFEGAERDVPDRVRQAIRSEQDRSEVLIGLMQTAIVVMFAILYAVSPKTFSRDATFEPVPWVLALYGAFTLLRLGLAWRTRLPGWFLSLSIVIDMALLFGLIWSFHLQYMQPPSFYLKAPTLLYVFWFIALRALRFEAGYVLFAGLVAAGGWAGMVAYAIAEDPAGGAMITRDYVYYLTANSILLGAEFDKIVSILVVTAIICVALLRARRLLVQAVSEGAAARDLSRFFAPEVAAHITRSETVITAGEGQSREAAILFLDVRGFTRLAAEMDPSAVMQLLADYQRLVVPIIRSHGGTIDKFLGDGIMATFGAAATSPTYAADALRALESVIDAAEAWNGERSAAGKPTLPINGAVASGRIVFGAIGDDARLEYTVIGDAVNLAAKLESHNKAARTRALTTAETHLLAQEQGHRSSRAPRVLPAEPVAGVERNLDLVALA